MKNHTKEDIIAFCNTIWGEPLWDAATIDVLYYSAELVQIKVSNMYESPKLNLEILMKLSKFFGTMNINDDDRFAESGCETCDYGSCYGFTLSVRPDNSEV